MGERCSEQRGGAATLISDLTPGSDDSLLTGFSSFASNDAFFAHVDSNILSISADLYKSDGTTPGTSSYTTLNCLPGGFFNLISQGAVSAVRLVNNHLIFPCQDFNLSFFFNSFDETDAFNAEPWVTDGTSGTTGILKDIFPGPISSGAYAFFAGNNKAIMPANDAVHGAEPWVTDGTTAGTTLLKDFNPGEGSSFNSEGLFFFSVIAPPLDATASLLPLVVGKQQKVVYSDGTLANTKVLFDDSADQTLDSNPREFTALGDMVIFSAKHTVKGNEPFVSDGTKKGTHLLKNIFRSGNSNPAQFVKFSPGKSLFVAGDPLKGRELWISDGSKAGTKRVKDIRSGAGASSVVLFKAKLGTKMLFSADDGVNGQELWITNGKGSGTKLLKDIAPGSAPSYPSNAAVMGGKAYFTANDGVNGVELWVSDGTAAGTQLLKDINPGSASSGPAELTVSGGKLFFSADDAVNGTELWVSDGTSGGTTLLKDIFTGSNGSYPGDLIDSEGTLFLKASSSGVGQELWRSDGTSGGTILIEDIVPGASSSAIGNLTAFPGGRVLFSAEDNVHGIEPWIAGNAPGSAEMLADIAPGTASSEPARFSVIKVSGTAYFSAYAPASGNELWKTDGTPAGTVLAHEFISGNQGGNPTELFVKGRKIFLSADDGKNGREPFLLKAP